jgi:rubrerythrin
VPAHLKLLDRLDALAGRVMDQPVRTDEDVMQAYLMLLVIEERAIQQFTAFIAGFDLVDRETSDVFRAIAKDEERHLRYCHAISKRYAPDAATWARELARFRKLEAQAFAENTAANLQHTFDSGLHAAGPVERMLWRGLTTLTSSANRLKTRTASFDLAAVGS